MKLTRREFVELAGASVVSMSRAPSARASSPSKQAEVVEKHGWRLQVTPSGNIDSLTDGKLELVSPKLGDNRPRVVIGGMRLYTCDRPSVFRREGSGLMMQYDFPGPDSFSVTHQLELVDLPKGLVTLKQKVGIQAATKINEGVKLVLPRNLQLPYENRKVFLPLKNGIGRRKPILGYESENEYVYAMAGGYEAMGKPQLLAIPMVDEYADQTDLRLTHCTDPYFSSYFYLAHGEKVGNFNCVYLGQVGLKAKEERVVYTGLHRGDAKAAMGVFYATSLAEVKPGPDWQHDVAMVYYD